MTFKLKQALLDVRLIFCYMAEDPILFSGFIFLSILSAITEGLGISLLVPILDVQIGGESTFANVPFFKYVAGFFEGLTSSEMLRLAAVLLGGVLLVRGGLIFLVQVMSLVIPISVQRRLTMKGYEALMYADISYIHNHDVGDLTNAINITPQRITMVLQFTASLVTNLFVLAVYAIMMLLISPEITFVSGLVLGASVFLMRVLLVKKIRALGTVASKFTADHNQSTYETMNGMKQIRLSGAEKGFVERFAKSYWDAQLIARNSQILGAVPGPGLTAIVSVFICGVLYWGAVAYQDNVAAWTSQLLLFMFLLMRLLSPVTLIAQARTGIVGHMPAIHETEAFLAELDARRVPNGDIVFDGLKQGIALDRVSFAYEGENKAVLQGVNMTIDKGQMIAVVGPSGAGKSTLVGLLTRLYDPLSGTISVDGVDLSKYDVTTWRKHVGVVSQDVVIFNDTVMNNIRFGLDGVSDDEVRYAAKQAVSDEFISDLPQGYDTVLGDRGVRLSGGQQQRIAIARAILTAPDLLIMDEGTSHLDSITEQAIQKAMESLSSVGRTMLVVAHRLSTIRRADKIIVMDSGQIVEQGTHVSLIAEKGVYWELLSHQRLDLLNDEDEQTQKEHEG